MVSPTFASHRYQNRLKPCDAAGCTFRRWNISKYCTTHHRSYYRYGHPNGRCIHKRDYLEELRLVQEFVTRHSDHPGIVTTLGLLKQWLDAAMMGEDSQVEGWREWNRLANHGVTPYAVLTTAAALFLLSRWKPRELPDDERLTFAIARRVLQLAPKDRRSTTRAGKPCLVSKAIKRVPLRAAGRRLRLALAPLFMNIAEAIIAEDLAAKKATLALYQPFPTMQQKESPE